MDTDRRYWLPRGAVAAIALMLPVLAGCMAAPGPRPVAGPGTAGTAPQTVIPQAIGDDSCQWARDGECDDARFAGTGACPIGTDATDCRSLAAGGDNSCQWAFDGECDEFGIGLGVCTDGTDTADCASVAHMRNRDNSCRTAFDGRCDEPELGTAQCAVRTDTVDCLGRATPPGLRDHHFGHDDRRIVDASSYPWSAIGELSFRGGGTCTATLVAPSVAITAAHCFFTDGRLDPPTTFLAGRDGNRHVARATVVRHVIAPGFDARRWDSSDSIDNQDWAFVVLDQPIGTIAGTIGVYPLTQADLDRAVGGGWHTVSQAGYSWDAPNRMTGTIGCRIARGRSNGTLFHECDTTQGDSGSPIFIEADGAYYIIALDSYFFANPGARSSYLAVDSRSFGPSLESFMRGL